MNYVESEVLLALFKKPQLTQRELAEQIGISLGLANRTLQALKSGGLLDNEVQLTARAQDILESRKPQRAIILAAGYGMRMVPVSNTPKALLEVRSERLIERQICQLHEAGVRDVCVVVGYRKEQFEYLTDQYGVKLLFNPEYAVKNNLHSLALAKNYLENSYIIPCDLWCEENPFRSNELCSWYVVSEEEDALSDVRVNRKGELVRKAPAEAGNRMVGIAYLCGEGAARLRSRLAELDRERQYAGAFWEEALYVGDRMTLPARVFPVGDAVEINTYEQLRELDSSSNNLQAGAIAAICKVFGVQPVEVTDIAVLKKGMTNRSFLFSVRGGQYIMRIPGEGTDKLINRRQEAQVYAAISGKGLCDDPVYINAETGYKITKYLPGVRTCDPENEEDLRRCMAKLREFHRMHLQVEHRFDLWGQIVFYESLWPSPQSMYRDYSETKAAGLGLKPWLDAQPKEECLTHIDAVCDNFLFTPDNCHSEPSRTMAWESAPSSQLTDWEYAGMQDPHVDLAMFAVYSAFDRAKLDHLIDLYFEGQCPRETRIKIYCYAAACGLLWSNWCEYKSSLGVEFGEYSLWQYRAAKEYSRLAEREIKQITQKLSLRTSDRVTGVAIRSPKEGDIL